MKRILVLEDDLALNAGLCYELDNAGYFTVSAYNCQKAMQIIKSETPDLAILDVNLPDGSGFDLCREIKNILPQLPVIFLTANDLEEDQIKGFDLGAEDYVTKPFCSSVLLRRIGVAFRNKDKVSVTEQKEVENGFDDGFLQIDFEKLSVVCNQEKLTMTPNEYKILKLLISNNKHIVTREIMLEKLWDNDGNFVNDHTLTVTVNRLRSKLEEHGHSYIKTVRGVGYAWNGEKL